MFLFGHIGITLGAAVIAAGILHRNKAPVSQPESPAVTDAGTDKSAKTASRPPFLVSWIESLSRFMDIRLLVLGSLLPDIIDKPLSLLGFGDGRSITHTLLVTMLLLIPGLYLYFRHHRTWLFAIAFGVVCHVLLDSMWESPQVFLWPSQGWAFPERWFSNYWDIWLTSLLHDPGAFIPEVLGVVIVIGLFWWLMGSRKFFSLIVRGRIGD